MIANIDITMHVSERDVARKLNEVIDELNKLKERYEAFIEAYPEHTHSVDALDNQSGPPTPFSW